MTCLTEFTCAAYADGEVLESESLQVAAHLETCGSCRRLVGTLRAESQALVHCLQDIESLEFELDPDTEATVPGSRTSLPKLAVFVLAMAAVLRPFLNVIADLEFPETLDWLNPFRASGLLNLLINAAAYFVPAATATIDSILDRASLIAFSAVVSFGIVLLFRRSAITSAVLSVIALLTVFSSSSYALDVRRGSQTVNVPTGDTVDDTLVVFADSVTIDGTVNGDLIAFARRISITGTVKGNVISFAQRIETEGTVEGSLLGFGQSVLTRGQVARNVYAFGQEVGVGNGGRVGGNATLFGAVGNVEGTVGRDVTAFAQRIDVRGDIERNVVASGQQVNVFAPARIGGSLSANVGSADSVHVDSGATIGGKTDIQLRKVAPSKYRTGSFYVWQTIWLVAAFITGLIVFWLAPALARVNLETGRALLIAGGVGVLAVIVPPIAAIISGITLIGLPLGFITLMLWLVACYLAKIVIAAFLGRSLLAAQGNQPVPFALMLLAGLVLVFIAVNLPYVGGLVSFFLTILGLGALVTTVFRMTGGRGPLTA